MPPSARENFHCLWATGTGWGTYSLERLDGKTVFAVKVLAGTLNCKSCEIAASGTAATVASQGKPIKSRTSRKGERTAVSFEETLRLTAQDEMRIEMQG
jgi:hypothetical protein